MKDKKTQFRISKAGLAAIFLCLALVVTLPLTAFAKESKPILLRYSSGLPPTHHVSKMQKFFAEDVAKRTAGRVKVQVYTGGELYKHTGVVDAVSMGAVEMGLSATGHWGGRNPVLNFPNYFFLIRSMDHWLRAKEGVWNVISPLFEKLNVKLLHFIAYGEDGVASVIPLDTPEAWKGKKIRGVTPGCLESIRGLGAVGTRIPAPEVYDALSKGAIDGAASGWSSFYSRKYYEVAKYYVGPLWMAVWVSFMNLDKWNSLPPDIQKEIMEASKAAENYSIQSMKEYDEKSLQVLREKGTVKYLSNDEIDKWAKMMEPVYQKWQKECAEKGYGVEGRKVFEELKRTAR